MKSIAKLLLLLATAALAACAGGSKTERKVLFINGAFDFKVDINILLNSFERVEEYVTPEITIENHVYKSYKYYLIDGNTAVVKDDDSDGIQNVTTWDPDYETPTGAKVGDTVRDVLHIDDVEIWYLGYWFNYVSLSYTEVVCIIDRLNCIEYIVDLSQVDEDVKDALGSVLFGRVDRERIDDSSVQEALQDAPICQINMYNGADSESRKPGGEICEGTLFAPQGDNSKLLWNTTWIINESGETDVFSFLEDNTGYWWTYQYDGYRDRYEMFCRRRLWYTDPTKAIGGLLTATDGYGNYKTYHINLEDGILYLSDSSGRGWRVKETTDRRFVPRKYTISIPQNLEEDKIHCDMIIVGNTAVNVEYNSSYHTIRLYDNKGSADILRLEVCAINPDFKNEWISFGYDQPFFGVGIFSRNLYVDKWPLGEGYDTMSILVWKF